MLDPVMGTRVTCFRQEQTVSRQIANCFVSLPGFSYNCFVETREKKEKAKLYVSNLAKGIIALKNGAFDVFFIKK